MADKTCKTCIENDNGLCDRKGILVEKDDTCEKHTKKLDGLFNGEIHPKINAVRAEMPLPDGKVAK